jgi:iron complex outermembrane receptor protein
VFGRTCPTIVSNGSRTWGQFNFKAGLEADLTDSSLLYANISTGEKPGGFDPGNFVGAYEPEKVKAYTLGSKNRFLENSLQVNAEAFYNDYKDLHANGFAFGNPPGFGPLPPDTIITFETINVPKSYTAGADLSTDYLVTNYDRLSVNVEYLIGKFKDFVLPAFPPVGQVYTNYSGLTKDRVPKWSGNASYDHTFSLGNIGKLVAGVRENFSSEVLLTYQRAPVGARQAGYGMTDASLTYDSPDDKWTAGVRIDNITDRGVQQDALATPAANPRGPVPTSYWGSPLPPRTYAAMFQYHF